MKKRNSTTLALSSAVLALMLIAAACSNDKGNVEPATSATTTAEANSTPAPSETASDAEPSEDAQNDYVTGEYVGLIDGHSIEIKTAGGTNAFQISPEIAEQVDPWAEGTKVKFIFMQQTIDVNGEKVTQNMIQSIEKQE